LTHLSTLIRIPPPSNTGTGPEAISASSSSSQPPKALLAIYKDSLRRAIETIKTQSLDKEAYIRAVVQLDLLENYEAGNSTINDEKIGLNGPNADTAWVERVEEEGKREAGKLDVELKGYMSNLIKESIRVSVLFNCPICIDTGCCGVIN
jgi:COP9 signalosome complex subunit 1